MHGEKIKNRIPIVFSVVSRKKKKQNSMTFINAKHIFQYGDIASRYISGGHLQYNNKRSRVIFNRIKSSRKPYLQSPYAGTGAEKNKTKKRGKNEKKKPNLSAPCAGRLLKYNI